MKPKFGKVFDYCIESGVEMGLNRAYKYEDAPSKETIREHIEREIFNYLYDWFEFEGETGV